jgi:hypothetical protein
MVRIRYSSRGSGSRTALGLIRRRKHPFHLPFDHFVRPTGDTQPLVEALTLSDITTEPQSVRGCLRVTGH